jgi:hypothetical protein
VAVVLAAVAVAVYMRAPDVAKAAMDFGSPPSGQIPIIYNDHHVYAKPDVLRKARVLAALIRNGTILVPLRSMFEQMGGTVSYDPATKGVTVQKSGASIQVRLGSTSAVINGASRPLDQGPIMYQGHMLVPVRVISETMGAYVEWVPSQRVVVVRYQPATPAPVATPTPAATPPPTPAPRPPIVPFNGFLQAAYNFGTVYNEFANGQRDISGAGRNGTSSGLQFPYLAKGGYIFDPWAIVGDFRQDRYNSTINGAVTAFGPPGSCNPPGTGNPATFFTVTGPPTQGQCGVPPFTATQTSIDARLEYKVINPHINIAGGYLWLNNNYSYPQLRGFGGGVEKLPDFDKVNTTPFVWFGSAFYYPNVNGTFAATQTSPATKIAYNVWKYDIGVGYNFGQSGFYVYGGFNGDKYTAHLNVPVDQTHSGPYAGFGFHF